MQAKTLATNAPKKAPAQVRPWSRERADQTRAALPPLVLEVMREPGRPLNSSTLAGLEQSIGASLHPSAIQHAPAMISASQAAICPNISACERQADAVAQAAAGISAGPCPNSAAGFNFGDVRIHTDSKAAESAAAIGAQAYTLGRDIVFGPGRYQPGTSHFRNLLAHELTHTLQQKHNGSASSGVVMRRWDKASKEDLDGLPTDSWIKKVVVNQEGSQNIEIQRSDGTVETNLLCSTGKGNCCVENPGDKACTIADSRRKGSNWTPITDGNPYTVYDRERRPDGWQYWTWVVPDRGIAIHYHHTVKGKPLSHGCIRTEMETARKIWCGARQGETKVHINGYPSPLCSDPDLIAEWRSDWINAALNSGEGEYLKILQSAYGRKLDKTELDKALDIANPDLPLAIPRSQKTAPPLTKEEKLLEEKLDITDADPLSERILKDTKIGDLLKPFTKALKKVTNLDDAKKLVEQYGEKLWYAARKRAQKKSTDDRPLYWARLQMTSALRQFVPTNFELNSAQREVLLDILERTSRGMTTAKFIKQQKGIKKILISGFDPFHLNKSVGGDPRRGNPSGAAVLALDNQTISNGAFNADIQGVIFPVRFADFDAGMVESFFAPFLTGEKPVDMVMTISQGGTKEFEVEEWAGRRRSSEAADNLGQSGGGTQKNPTVPKGLETSTNEFLPTSLPKTAIRTALGRTTPLTDETQVTEIPFGGTDPVSQPAGPTAGSIAVEGSGGGYLSNEIFYRTAYLRTKADSLIPLGHLHTPVLDPPGAGLITDAGFEKKRDEIIATIKEILKAALPDI